MKYSYIKIKKINNNKNNKKRLSKSLLQDETKKYI